MHNGIITNLEFGVLKLKANATLMNKEDTLEKDRLHTFQFPSAMQHETISQIKSKGLFKCSFFLNLSP